MYCPLPLTFFPGPIPAPWWIVKFTEKKCQPKIKRNPLIHSVRCENILTLHVACLIPDLLIPPLLLFSLGWISCLCGSPPMNHSFQPFLKVQQKRQISSSTNASVCTTTTLKQTQWTRSSLLADQKLMLLLLASNVVYKTIANFFLHTAAIIFF